ncbi:MAG: hypothetical protein PVJ80_10920 [Gemmatimonadota bacterium]
MNTSPDRRAFLRRAAIAALGMPVASALGCTLERQDRGARSEPLGPVRPILLPWGDDAVRIAAPPRERPVAYMSRRYMMIWVDHEFRDRLSYALNAHISVSTGHWRIPLPGDPPNIPITPGDERREYEEFDARFWDAEIEPAEGDVRILRGIPTRSEVRIECQPLSGGGTWLSAEPLRLFRCGPPGPGLCREDLMEVGTAASFADWDCTQGSGSMRLVTWACRDAAPLEGV